MIQQWKLKLMSKQTLMKIDVCRSSTYPFFLPYIVIQMAILMYVNKLFDCCWGWSSNFWLLIWRADSLKKSLTLGKNEGKKREGQQRLKWLDCMTNTMDMNLSKLWEIVKNREVPGITKSKTQLNNWTIATNYLILFYLAGRALLFISDWT